MAINKIVYNGGTLIDLTSDTVTADKLLEGYTAHDRSGTLITGTASGSGSGAVWQDVNGYVHLSDEGDIELQTKSVTPSESAQQVRPDSGYYALSSVSVGAISSAYVGSGITRRGSSDLTVSGATVAVPAGYYSAQATKSVATTTHASPTASINTSTGLVTASHTQAAGYVTAGTTTGTLQLSTQAAATITPSTSQQTAVAANRYTTGAVTVAAMPTGTAGTPTATKGTVSNHSVSVTPSVTNSTGYITGGTKTGTAVTVSASELVSGNLAITDNGTGINVANYASVDVNVSGGAATLVTGTFTTGSTRTSKEAVSINYAGNGFPMAFTVYTTTSVSAYDVKSYSAVKNNDTAPTWTTASAAANTTSASYIYYNGTTIIGTDVTTNAGSFMGSQYVPAAGINCAKFFGNSATFKYYIGNSTISTHGLAPNTTYTYIIVYSE